jgi:hypothetical protein
MEIEAIDFDLQVVVEEVVELLAESSEKRLGSLVTSTRMSVRVAR